MTREGCIRVLEISEKQHEQRKKDADADDDAVSHPRVEHVETGDWVAGSLSHVVDGPSAWEEEYAITSWLDGLPMQEGAGMEFIPASKPQTPTISPFP